MLGMGSIWHLAMSQLGWAIDGWSVSEGFWEKGRIIITVIYSLAKLNELWLQTFTVIIPCLESWPMWKIHVWTVFKVQQLHVVLEGYHNDDLQSGEECMFSIFIRVVTQLYRNEQYREWIIRSYCLRDLFSDDLLERVASSGCCAAPSVRCWAVDDSCQTDLKVDFPTVNLPRP